MTFNKFVWMDSSKIKIIKYVFVGMSNIFNLLKTRIKKIKLV